MSLAKMTYDAATGTVIYRSKMHLGLKRNFQVMPGAQWLALLCRHIPHGFFRELIDEAVVFEQVSRDAERQVQLR